MCEKLGTLPDSGGLLDQDSYLMHLFQAVFDADAEAQSMENNRMNAKRAELDAKLKAMRNRR